MTPKELVVKHRTDAEEYRQKQYAAQSRIQLHKCAGMAEVYDKCADELEQALAGDGGGEDAKLSKLQSSDNLYHVNLTCAELQAKTNWLRPCAVFGWINWAYQS